MKPKPKIKINLQHRLTRIAACRGQQEQEHEASSLQPGMGKPPQASKPSPTNHQSITESKMESRPPLSQLGIPYTVHTPALVARAAMLE
jgi:hypothetical protein